MKVLAIDDAGFVHQIYRTALKKVAGCTLLEARDGLEGLRRLDEQGPVDLIILDLNMPRMDGLQFLAELKRRPEWGTHVTVSTTEDQEGKIREALQLGASSFIKKPFTLEQLSELLRRVLPLLGEAGGGRPGAPALPAGAEPEAS
ncbi:MAG TPA: response regulator [Myxococcales bacterium]|jgi:CheY-like chemotaxis protein